MGKKKILYSIASHAGGGHITCAKAIIDALTQVKGEVYEHKIIDLAARGTKFWNFISNSYGFMSEHTPWLFKFMYYSTNDPSRFKALFNLYYPLYKNTLFDILNREKPDLILSLFAPPTSFLVRGVRELKWDVPVIAVVLDPISVHASWVDPGITRQVVATEEARQACIQFGLAPEKIKVIGFPTNPNFLKEFGDKRKHRREMGLEPELFTVLLMGGGIGALNIYGIVRALNASDLNIQIIVIAGWNKKLESKLKRTGLRFPAKIIGFTDRVPEIMGASDCLITKAGPGTIYEAMARELPLIINGNIPGQEEGNVDYVQKNKIGIIARGPDNVVEAVKSMQKSGTEEFRSNMRRIRNTGAVYEIAQLIASYLPD